MTAEVISTFTREPSRGARGSTTEPASDADATEAASDVFEVIARILNRPADDLREVAESFVDPRARLSIWRRRAAQIPEDPDAPAEGEPYSTAFMAASYRLQRAVMDEQTSDDD
jgi:hypothetical protein